jgi:hypothetical protein
MWSAIIATSPNLIAGVFFRNIVRMMLVSVCLLALPSCGYRFAGGGALPQGVDSLFIELLDNKTTEPGVDVLVTYQLKNEFIRKYPGALVDRGVAAAILSGTVVGVRTETVSRRGVLTALERSVSLTVDLTLKTVTNKRIWFAKGIKGSDTYSVVSGDKESTEENKRIALRDIAQRIAETAFYRLTDDF